MNKLAKALVLLAVFCLCFAIVIKLSSTGKLFPVPFFLNWAKLADTFLLFSIALSLLGKVK